jgi:hypothetical protein
VPVIPSLALAFLGRAALAVALGSGVLLAVRPTAEPQTLAPLSSIRPAQPAATGTQPRPAAASFALTMSDADLTKAAASGFPQTVSGVTVTDPAVRVESGGVRLTAAAKVLFGTTQFVLLTTPSAEAGRIAVRVDSATLAGVSLPDSTRASIADTVQQTIARLVPANVRVTSVTLASGRLTVLGTQP